YFRAADVNPLNQIALSGERRLSIHALPGSRHAKTELLDMQLVDERDGLNIGLRYRPMLCAAFRAVGEALNVVDGKQFSLPRLLYLVRIVPQFGKALSADLGEHARAQSRHM